MKKYISFLIIFLLIIFISNIQAATYYISTTGNDSSNGTAISSAWATFNRAWQTLQPGDTLLIADGIYNQSIAPNVRDGNSNPAINVNDYVTYPLDHPERIKNYIKVKAINDGKVIIDGQGQRIPVSTGYAPNNWWVGSYFLFEGFIARNSSESVFEIETRNVVIRRCSGYNANTDLNAHVFTIYTGCCNANSTSCDPTRFCTTDNPSNVLLEDCVAGGTGRKMFMAYGSYVNVVFRRVFALWTSWDAKECTQDQCAAHWPWGDGIEVYNWIQPDLPSGWSNSIIENSILYGRLSNWGFSLSPNPTETYDNKFLGDIAVKVGMDWNGNQMNWPCPNPWQPWFPCVKWDQWQTMRAGFSFGSHGTPFFKDNLFQDLFAFSNEGVGIGTGPYASGSSNNRLVRGTFINNGLADNILPSESHQDWSPISPSSNLTSATDVYLSTNPNPNVTKAKLQYRYVNGTMMDGTNGQPAQNLWPWPMEDRIKTEFSSQFGLSNFSVTQKICEEILKPNGSASVCGGAPPPPPPPDTTPPVISSVNSTSITSNSATINWSTDESSDSQVEYGLTTAYGSFTPLDVDFFTTHSVQITGLSASTLYHYRVKSKDSSGNLATSGDFNFTTSAPPPPPPPGALVAAYGFEEGTGTAIADSSGNSNNGVASNTIWSTAGKFGKALSFNGTSAFVTIADSTSLDLTTGMTLEAWVNPVAISGWRTVVMKEQTNDNSYWIYANDDQNKAQGGVKIGSYYAGSSTTQLPLNTWSYLAVTYDGTTVKFFVNGTQTGSRAVTGNIEQSNSPLKIGGNAVWGEYFNGLIDEVRVYSRALQQSEIQADMGLPVVGTVPPPDTTPPVISSVSANSVTEAQATIVWSTNEASDSQVDFGLTASYGNSTALNTNLVTSHSVQLNGLASSTLYHFRVKSKDSSGNLAVSSDFTFTTLNITPPPTDFTIANINAPSQVENRSKFEFTFDISGTVAKNLQLPFVANPPNGIDPTYDGHKGISVDAEFSPDNWATVFRQPAFFYHFYQDGGEKQSWDGHFHEWYYPTGQSKWMVRFSPNSEGTWKYRIKATDASGTITSAETSFTVVPSTKKGIIKVSSADTRYFEFNNGELFNTPGIEADGSLDDPIKNNVTDLTKFQDNHINFVRIWGSSLYGAAWPQWLGGRNIYNGYLPRPGLLPFHDSVRNRDVMAMYITYPEGWYDACQNEGWDDSEAVKPNTNYKFVITYWGEGITGPRISGNSTFGLVGKIGASTNCYEPNTGTVVTTYGKNTTDWATLEGVWNSGNNNFLPTVALGLENVIQGKAHVLSISLKEVLPNGQLGPEIMNEPSMEYEINFPDSGLYMMDKYLELAESKDIFIKFVLFDKNDYIYYKLDDDGTFVIGTETDNLDGFYGLGRGMNKTRWLQQAWWRYVQARWGYSANIHSWELTNEGDPYLNTHWEMTDELGKFMHCGVFGVNVGAGDSQPCTFNHPNKHLITTSFWEGFPGYAQSTGQGFWGNPKYPNVDYADVHAYITTSPAPDADKIIMQWDSAYYHLWHSNQYSSWNFNFPIVRGEAGMTPYNTSTDDWGGLGLLSDTQGIWYHNYLWSGIDKGALYEMYWHTIHIFNQDYDHRPAALSLNNFIKDIPLNNGFYVDSGATSGNSNLRLVGQKDLTNNNAYLWVQNKNHTWKNVVDGVTISPITDTVSINGFTPNTNFSVEKWDTYTGQLSSTSSIAANSSGVLSIPVTALVSDIALKIRGSLQPPPPPKPSVAFTITPNPITVGQTATLTWTTFDATTVSIDQGIGQVSLSGSSNVSPTVTTTYTLTATGDGGTTTASVTLTVNPAPTPPIINSLTFNKTRIKYGQSATGTVRLDKVAPSGGTTVILNSSSTQYAQVPSSIVVAAGTTTKTFTVTTTSNPSGGKITRNVTITASANNSSKSVVLTLVR